MFILLLVFIILLGIVGTLCCADREEFQGTDSSLNAEDFEIISN